MLNDLKTALMHNFGPLTLYLLKAQIMLQGFPVNFKQLEGMVPTNNGDILHRLILGKTKSGEVIKDWSNQDWNGICRQCGTVLETFQHIFECEVVKSYYNDLSNHLGVFRIYDLKSLLGDHYLWHVAKEKPKILAQFALSSFIIAEISAGKLTGDKLCWRRTEFKLVVYLTHLLR